MKRCLLAIGWLILRITVGMGSLNAGEAKLSLNVDWEKIVAGAKREGRLNLYLCGSPDFTLQQFHKVYPEIKVISWSANCPQEAQRVMTERRAGKYLLDLFSTGPTTPFSIFYRGRALDPIQPVLILPEVEDQSKWFEGKHHYVDPEGHYIFLFEGTAQSYIHYNTHVVKRDAIKSYWDLLDPKWRGKIITGDPMVPGIISHGIRFMYNHPELGPKFLTRLFSEMDITVLRDRRQMVDWLASGKSSLCLFCYGINTGREQGLPVDTAGPYSLKEGASIVPITGTTVLMNQAPHPNAAKVFINWFLSREGQIAHQKSHLLAGSASDSLRIDIPKDDVPLESRRRTSGKYLMSSRPEWMDLAVVQKLIKQAMAEAKRK